MGEEVHIAQKEIEVEMPFLQTFTKIIERGMCILEAIKQKQNKILETDYDVMQAIHGCWFRGEIAFPKKVMVETNASSKKKKKNKTKTTEQLLFSDKKAEEPANDLIGTDIATTLSEPIKD